MNGRRGLSENQQTCSSAVLRLVCNVPVRANEDSILQSIHNQPEATLPFLMNIMAQNSLHACTKDSIRRNIFFQIDSRDVCSTGARDQRG